MFNSINKYKFINDYSANMYTQKDCVTLFDATQPLEEQYGVDLYQMDQKMLQETVNSILGIRARSRSVRFGILKDYIKWCQEQDLPFTSSAINVIEIEGIDKLKTRMVKNPLHLQVYLDSICNPEADLTITNTYRCYYWLAYAGMKEEDAISVSKNDVKFDSMTVEYNKHSFPIYREAIPAFKNCINLRSFRYIHPGYDDDSVIWKERVPGACLIRGVKNQPSTFNLRTELSKRGKRAIDSGNTNLALSYNRVWLSGLFYRMYERETAGYPVDFSGAATLYMQNKEYKCGADLSYLDKYRRKIMLDYEKDYERWKLILD